jgi:hypothetical protein
LFKDVPQAIAGRLGNMAETYNTLIERIAERASKLANMDMVTLRLTHPDSIEDAVSANLKNLRGVSRGECIEAILLDEFQLEFDIDIENIA